MKLSRVNQYTAKKQSLQLNTVERSLRTSLFDYAPDGIVIADTNGYYLDANPSMCQMLGYTHEELVGLHASQVVTPEEVAYIEPALRVVNSNANYHRQWKFKRKDDSFFEAEVFSTILPDGSLLGMVRDISSSKAHEQEILRLSKLYAASSQINQAIIRTRSRQKLFHKICQILVEHGGMQLAWIGLHDAATNQLLLAADCGDKYDYLGNIKVYTDDSLESQGLSALAFRTHKSCICNNMQHDPITLPWREKIIRSGFESCAVFPIREKGKVCGTLSVYAKQAFFFNEKEIELLEEVALNISLGLDNLLREEERASAEAALRNEKNFSTTIIENMPGVLFFFDYSGKVLRWNKNFETVSGYTAREIAGMHPLDFFSEQDKALISANIAEVLAKGKSFVEAPLINKNGEAKQHFFTGEKVNFNGMQCFVGIGLDVTEINQAKIKQAETEHKYIELVDSANCIILRWNADGKVTSINEFGQKFFGYTSDEIVGQHVVGTVVPFIDSDGRNLQLMIEKICSDPKAFEQNINENMRSNGERVWVAWTNKFAYDEHGKLIEILGIGIDVTQRLQAENAVKELNATLEKRVIERTEELNAALYRAELADKTKSAFLATMSHELRTPLNSIIGFTGIILQGLAGPLNDEQTKQLVMVKGSARHLLELINDVLDISKIEAGELNVHPKSFDLRESIEHVVGTVRPLAEKKKLMLCVRVADEVREMLCDQRRLEQILINLLNNAIKFTEHGGIILTVELTNDYSLDNMPSQPSLIFSVKDTGIGIKAEELETIFKEFHQLDSGLTRQYEGTGLGLAICRRLATLMGGQVSVISEWSKGSEFKVVIPLYTFAGK